MMTLTLGEKQEKAKFSPFDQEPLVRLQGNPIWEQWESTLERMGDLLLVGELRNWILSLPDFPLDPLIGQPRQTKRAYVIFAFLTQGWIRGANNAELLKYVPDKLGIPFKKISDSIGMKPVISYAAVCLFNWKKIDSASRISPKNLAINSSFTGSLDEKWFLLVPLRIELLWNPAYRAIQAAIEADNTDSVIIAFEELNSLIGQACETLKSMHLHCAPSTFYHRVRRFFSGSLNDTLLPNGVFQAGKWEKFPGASAAQSPFVHLIDGFLGVEHTSDYMKLMREMIPLEERMLIEHVSQNSSNLRNRITENELVLAAWNAMVDRMVEFRSEHFKLTALYILNQMPKTTTTTTSNDSNSKEEEALGTGGTKLVAFLKENRRETQTQKK